jgi:hypothetical protein
VYKAQYCFYHPTGANLPSLKAISIVYVDPIPDTILRVCSYDPGGDPLIPPVITRQPTDQVGCLGYKSIFSVAAIKGEPTDTAIKYQWMKDGVDIPGATDSFLVITVTAADTGADRYMVRIISQPSLAIQLSVQVSLTLNKQKIWNGSGGTAWNLAGNWTPSGIPDSTMHVYVANTANKPLLNGPLDTGRCKCLTLDTGWVNLMLLGRLEVAGRIQPFMGGYINGVDGQLVVNGTELPQDLPDNVFLQNTLRSLGFANIHRVINIDTLDITGSLFPILDTLITNGLITLKSKRIAEGGTARVAERGPGAFVSGDVTAERYIPCKTVRTWRALSPITFGPQTIKQSWQENGAPISSGDPLLYNPNPGYGTFVTAGQFSGFDETDGFDKVMPLHNILRWDVPTQSLGGLISNTNMPLSSESAWFLYVRGTRAVLPAPVITNPDSTTLRSKGALRQGDQPAIIAPPTFFVMVGNPYAATINFANIAPLDKVGLGDRFWLWDPALAGSYNLGTYVLFDASAGYTPSNTSGSWPLANSLVPSGMAFFVQGGLAGGVLTLRESIKTGSNDNQGFKTTTNNDRLQIQLAYMKTPTTPLGADGAFVVYGDAYTNAVDDHDALKPINMGENMAVVKDDKDLALDARPRINSNDTVQLKLWKLSKEVSTYRFSFSPNFQTKGVKAVLVDKYLNESFTLDMTKPTNVDFLITKDSATFKPDRFYIALSVDAATIIKEVPDGDIVVYPNPTDAQHINITMKNAEGGQYTFNVTNVEGKVVHVETHDHSGNTMTKTLNVQSRLVPGNYFIGIIKDGQRLSTQKLIIK